MVFSVGSVPSGSASAQGLREANSVGEQIGDMLTRWQQFLGDRYLCALISPALLTLIKWNPQFDRLVSRAAGGESPGQSSSFVWSRSNSICCSAVRLKAFGGKVLHLEGMIVQVVHLRLTRLNPIDV